MTEIETAKTLLAQYVDSPLPANTQFVPDPYVPYVYAARFIRDRREGFIEFLIYTNETTPDDAVEEVEFSHWPPAVGFEMCVTD